MEAFSLALGLGMMRTRKRQTDAQANQPNGELGVTTSVDSEVEELKQDVTAEAVLNKLESADLNAAPLAPSPGRGVSG